MRSIFGEQKPAWLGSAGEALGLSSRAWAVPIWTLLSESVAFFAGRFLSAEAVVLGGKDSIEFFNEYEESVAVFLYGDEGTEFLDAIAVGFVHREKQVALNHLARF